MLPVSFVYPEHSKEHKLGYFIFDHSRVQIMSVIHDNLEVSEFQCSSIETHLLLFAGILTQNEQLYQANNKWGTAYHDLEDIYQRRLDEEEKIRKRMELKARQLAIENHALKNKFSDYGKGREDPSSTLGYEDELEASDALSSESYSSDESDMEKVSLQ